MKMFVQKTKNGKLLNSFSCHVDGRKYRKHKKNTLLLQSITDGIKTEIILSN